MRIGERTVAFDNGVYIVAGAAVTSHIEDSGHLKGRFDLVYDNDLMGQQSYEKAEGLMHFTAIQQAVRKLGKLPDDIELMIGSDLLNQIVATTHTARKIDCGFLGLYGACSGFGESLAIGSMAVDSYGFGCVSCSTSSHFSTSERQYRFPLELGTQPCPTSQRTVTGSGCTILSATEVAGAPRVVRATLGRVVDMGVRNAANMGAAMAPAALDTLVRFFTDTGTTPEDFDAIVTGDLGKFGSEILLHYAEKQGFDIADKHVDCGELIFRNDKKKLMGGSGAGCCSAVFNAYWLPELQSGRIGRMLFLPTGALLSKNSPLQGEDIPAICYAIEIEGCKNDT